MNGHETAHLLFTDFTTLGLYLRSMENGSFYPKEPSFDDQYQESCEGMLEAMHEKDKAVCLTLSQCASHISNILEDIYIEARMCDAYPGTFKQGIELNSLRMNELMPSLQSQIDKGYSDFSIVANLLLQYCRSGTVNNLNGYTGPYLDYLEDCVPYFYFIQMQGFIQAMNQSKKKRRRMTMTTHMELKTAAHLSDQEMEKIYRIRQCLYWEMDFISRCRERKKEGIGLCNLPYQTLSEEKKLLDLAYELYNDMEDSNTAYNVTLDLVIDETWKYIKDNPCWNMESEVDE